jgi:acyl-[acyl-carrier-protein]-phospholipid O-acyltransferase/long-chain-fatty-acid--[acyl-carrier-protein] ligase
MVPHVRVEEVINSIIGESASIVTAVPEPRKGECLVVLHTQQSLDRDEVWERLCRTDLPRLWIPKREHFYYVEAIPTLATGKVDLQQVKRLALDQVGEHV